MRKDRFLEDHIVPGEAVEAKPLEVVVGEHFEKAFRAFRTKVQKDGILSLFKEKRAYEKPSDKRRRKRNQNKDRK